MPPLILVRKMSNIKNINEIIGDSKSVIIVGHIRPDGDCIGSAMGLYNYLTDNFDALDVQVYLMKPLPGIFDYMRGYDKVKWADELEQREYDLCICVDCGSIDRLEGSEYFFNNAGRTYCIDHHLSNSAGFADDTYLDVNASSTCELVADLLDKDRISAECAACLYTGIITDTGVFKFGCTSAKTMSTAAMLMDKGIDFSYIIDRAFFEKTYAQNQILGRVLMESLLICEGRCIVGVVKQKDMSFYGIEPRHLEGIVNQLLNTRGVEVAIFIYELESMTYKASIRSKTFVNVIETVKPFGGGGHKHAAGCTMHGSSYDVINALSHNIDKQLKANI